MNIFALRKEVGNGHGKLMDLLDSRSNVDKLFRANNFMAF